MPGNVHDIARAMLVAHYALRDELGREPRTEEVAARAGLSVERVQELRATTKTVRLAGHLFGSEISGLRRDFRGVRCILWMWRTYTGVGMAGTHIGSVHSHCRGRWLSHDELIWP